MPAGHERRPGHGAAPPGAAPAPADHGGGRFGRLFPRAARPDVGDAAVDEIVRRIGGFTQHSDNPTIPAGYTYLGQFVDHDLTFDPLSRLGHANALRALVNFRTPRLDLDSLYGSGPADQPFLYEWTERRDRGVKLLVGRHDGVEDLPRNAQGLALVGDARNDENLIVAQLHLLFIGFHNAVVDWLRGPGAGRARAAAQSPAELFERARRIVRRHYQWIVTHDFLRRIVGQPLATDVLRDGDATAPVPARVHLRHFDAGDAPRIPVEFSGAAYRFGHSMVRPSYVIAENTTATIFPVGDAAPGDGDLSGFRPLPAALAIEWKRFFWKVADGAGTNASLRINNRINPMLFAVPDRGALPWLNLQRGRALRLPSGPAVAAAMGEDPLDVAKLQLDPADPAGVNAKIVAETPLWYYVLCEAGVTQLGGAGEHLGPVGGRIVAEVLVGLLQADPASYLREDPAWRPRELPAATAGDFTMTDLVAFVADAAP